MDSDSINKKIGMRIRDLRNRNGLTQQELADRTELTKGFISLLERGQVSASIVTLMDLIECLGTTPSDFFEEAAEEQVVFQKDGFFEKIDENGTSVQWIVPTAQKNRMEPILVSLKGLQKIFEHKPHEGEEFGYILTGRIRIHLGEKVYNVGPGESFYFSSDCEHYIENPYRKDAEFIWVSTPPTF